MRAKKSADTGQFKNRVYSAKKRRFLSREEDPDTFIGAVKRKSSVAGLLAALKARQAEADKERAKVDLEEIGTPVDWEAAKLEAMRLLGANRVDSPSVHLAYVRKRLSKAVGDGVVES